MSKIKNIAPEIQALVAEAGYLLIKPIRLAKLIRVDEELAALEAAGVDNTDAFGEVDWEKVDKGVVEALHTIGLQHAQMLGLDGDEAQEHAKVFVSEYE